MTATQQSPPWSGAHHPDQGPAPRVLGLDLSLTSTGVAGAGWTNRIRTNTRGHDRISHIQDELAEYIHGAALVVIEGPSYGSSEGRQAGHHERAGLWWIVTHRLWRHDIPLAVVTPAQLKMYATGRGNAGKDEVLAAVIRRYPNVEISGNDEADALVLAAMGLDYLGCPLVVVPATHRRGLDKVAWPEAVAA